VLGLFSRILSHSLRLFGNIAGEHVVAGIFFSLVPLLIPVPLMVMGLFFGLIQTFAVVIDVSAARSVRCGLVSTPSAVRAAMAQARSS
jgi:uncharacterized membrane protein